MEGCVLVTGSVTTAHDFEAIAVDAGLNVVSVGSTFDAPTSGPIDLLVLDVGIGADESLRICADALRNELARAVIFLGPPQYDEIREAIETGARGFLCMNSHRTFLESAVRAVMDGHTVLDPQVTAPLLANAIGSEHSAIEKLSERELETLKLVGQGESNRRIARRLGVGENTIKTYMRRAFRKLDCHSRPEAAALLARHGLL